MGVELHNAGGNVNVVNVVAVQVTMRPDIQLNAGSCQMRIPSVGFKVLDNGALQIAGGNKITFAPGTWIAVQLILEDDLPHE